MVRLLSLLGLLVASAASAQSPQPQQSQAGGMPLVAIPPLPTPKIEQTPAGPTHAIGLQVAEVIAADLRSTGAVAPMGPANLRVYSYPEVTAPLFQQWRTVGAKSLVTGFVQLRPDGRLTIGCYLYDIAGRRELARKGFVVPVTEWRRAAHRCSDAAYEAMTGNPGLFDSTIVYVAESGSRYERQKRIAIMDGDGGDHRFLTPGTATAVTPRLSPQGDFIAYTAINERRPQVRIMDSAGAGDRPLLPGDAMTFAPAFSPDGQSLLVSMAVNGNTDLYLVGLNGGQPRRLTSTPGVDTAGSFSPDGKRIVFESDRSGSAQLYVMNADGSDQQRISFGGGRYSEPAWSPGADLIAFNRGSGIGVMRADGGEERMLTANPLDESPAWSPNGQNILFSRPGSVAGLGSLYSVSLKGGDERIRVTAQGGSDAHWSQVQE